MRKIIKMIKRAALIIGGLFALLFIGLVIDVSNDDEQAATETAARLTNPHQRCTAEA